MQVRRLPEAVARHCAKLVKLQLLRPGDVAPPIQKGYRVRTASADTAPSTARLLVASKASMILRLAPSQGLSSKGSKLGGPLIVRIRCLTRTPRVPLVRPFRSVSACASGVALQIGG